MKTCIKNLLLLPALSGWLNLQAGTFTVTNLLNSGAGSFRQAILDANAATGTNTITFNIPGPAPFSLKPTSGLPAITTPVKIDGTTQPGYAGMPLIELNGAFAGAGVQGLLVNAGNSTIQGLVINGFDRFGIFLQIAGNNMLRGNYIGTDISGSFSVPNSWGIAVVGVPNNVIGGQTSADRNLISGNRYHGIEIAFAGCTGTKVQGNFIGTDLTGANGLQNGDTGIDIHDGASGVTLGGLADGARNIISGNFYRGIYFQSAASSNLVQGNYLGTDVTGTNRLGNGQDGILIGDSGSTGNLIGGTVPTARNVISGNGNQGVDIYNHASGNIVQGNFIGTDVNGRASLGNLSDGVLIEFAANNLIGGTSPGAGNLISANTPNGVEIYASSASGNVVQGNLIGTDTSGTLALGNTAFGVNISSGASNTIGGTSTGARNIISGNGLSGVFIGNNSGDAAATGNRIQGNFLGTDITGTADLGNGEDGVFISGAVNNTIGGTNAAARNIISANGHFGRVNDGRSGIEIWDNASGNVVQGNLIGTDLTGTNGLGNKEYGVFIQNSSRNTTGGTLAGAGNLIAHNQKAGVAVQSGTNNPVRANSIFANAGLGIDLGLNGVTGNDAGDPDSGPNNLQNYPVLSSALLSSGTLTIRGTLNSRSNTSCQLDFYANNDCDSSGYGQGQAYLGSGNFTTDGSGNVNFNLSLTASVMPGQAITATATDPNGNTSEFSHCLAIVSADVRLSVATSTNGISLSWPSSASGVRLQSTTNLLAPVLWQDVLDSPIDDGTTKTLVITNDPSVINGFYRLVYP